jgi:anti-sigma regulatory factor (Ser/Thr protein kinase)
VQKIQLHITSDPRFLRLVRTTIDQISFIAGFSKLDRSKIVLAVDEACSNVIRHAYKEKPGLPIIITCIIRKHELAIDIIDQGEKVDIKSIKPRPLDEIRPGGLGVHLIKSVMDNVSYSHLEKVGNRLLMRKSLPKEAPIES